MGRKLDLHTVEYDSEMDWRMSLGLGCSLRAKSAE